MISSATAPIVDARAVSGPAKGILGDEQGRLPQLEELHS
jgi:hypothetical protein